MKVRKGENLMPYISPENVAKAKQLDLYTYLRNYEPHELVHFGATPTARGSMTA